MYIIPPPKETLISHLFERGQIVHWLNNEAIVTEITLLSDGCISYTLQINDQETEVEEYRLFKENPYSIEAA